MASFIITHVRPLSRHFGPLQHLQIRHIDHRIWRKLYSPVRHSVFLVWDTDDLLSRLSGPVPRLQRHRHVEDISDFQRSRDSPTIRPGSVRPLQPGRCGLDVLLLQGFFHSSRGSVQMVQVQRHDQGLHTSDELHFRAGGDDTGLLSRQSAAEEQSVRTPSQLCVSQIRTGFQSGRDLDDYLRRIGQR